MSSTSAIAASSSNAGARRRHCDGKLWLLQLTAALACSQPAAVTTPTARVPAPTPNDRGTCADLGEKRVCWHDGGVTSVPRTVPAGPVPLAGWRCGGSGEQRVCEDRSQNASSFTCGTTRCLQTRPRMPDAGEWECVEIGGVAYCRDRGALAGMPAGPLDLGWQCAPRRGSESRERICLDFDPDRPNDAARSHCRYELQNGVAQRSCVSAAGLVVGSRCDASEACPDGTQCREGVCLPERPQPGCWLDRDCGAGTKCRFGSCSGE